MTTELPQQTALPTLSQLVPGERKCVPRDSTGRGLLEAYVYFPPDFPPCTFSFCQFALCPVTVINLSHDYSDLLSPVSSGQFRKLGVVLEPPTQGPSSLRPSLPNALSSGRPLRKCWLRREFHHCRSSLTTASSLAPLVNDASRPAYLVTCFLIL